MVVICITCKSKDVVRDASVEWNPQTKKWEIVSILNRGWCKKCGSEALPKEYCT